VEPRPWFKFWSKDWIGDVRIRALSLEERGLLIELRAMMAQTEPHGVLSVIGPVTDCRDPKLAPLARVIGVPPEVLGRHLQTLCAAGLLQVAAEGPHVGLIQCPAMVRDAEKSAHGRSSAMRRYGTEPPIGVPIGVPSRVATGPPSRYPTTHVLPLASGLSPLDSGGSSEGVQGESANGGGKSAPAERRR